MKTAEEIEKALGRKMILAEQKILELFGKDSRYVLQIDSNRRLKAHKI